MEAAARWLGVVLQSVLLGVLVTVAILELLAAAGAEAIFHYQGF